jgi:agmatine deiminase
MESNATPSKAGFFQPAEWDRHESVWLAWPSAEDLWDSNLLPAQEEFVAFCTAIADLDSSGLARGEQLNVLVPDEAAAQAATKALLGLPVKFHKIPFGDIWLRDTAPIFLKSAAGEIAPVRFQFNGWGNKYCLPFDSEVSTAITQAAGLKREFHSPWVLEGGSVEVDGQGTCLTSRQCLLNANRNGDLNQSEIEAKLRESLGVQTFLWIGDGLINDHTDGHIDTIARFAAPGVILCMESRDPSDPNHLIFESIKAELSNVCDARGNKIQLGMVPSPGAIINEDSDTLMPASYLNFYIANTTVIVPTYGSVHDEEAVAAIAKWFPGRRTVGLSARAILSGGGAFHCISQQQPSASTLIS